MFTDKKLNIFTNFEKMEFEEDKTEIRGMFASDNGTIWMTSSSGVIDTMNKRYKLNLSFLAKWFYFVVIRFSSPDKVFKKFKYNFKKISYAEKSHIENNMERMLRRSKQMKQVALTEEIERKQKEFYIEERLIIHKIMYNITEEDLFKVYNSTLLRKGLKLDWIKNFTREIPDESFDKIIYCMDNRVFDNIVILHYDLLSQNSSPTKKEVEKAKDPIAFGVFKDSNKLYFITDWIDEHCDLTLDKLIETLDGDLEDYEILNKYKDIKV